jgi:hypothetical protein
MLKFLLEKEIKLFRRNKFLPRIVIVLPLMALLILPLAANFEIKISISVLLTTTTAIYPRVWFIRSFHQDISGLRMFPLPTRMLFVQLNWTGPILFWKYHHTLEPILLLTNPRG